jgi:hypothetical protein
LEDGRVVRGTADGYLIALNMANGTLLWSQKIIVAQSPSDFEELALHGLGPHVGIRPHRSSSSSSVTNHPACSTR